MCSLYPIHVYIYIPVQQIHYNMNFTLCTSCIGIWLSQSAVFFVCVMLFVDSLFAVYKTHYPLNSLILCMQEISEIKIVS